MPIRFHLDENVDPAVGMGLRRRGVDVTLSQEVGLLGVDDQTQAAFARDSGRVLVTHDNDFLRLAATGVLHAGIAYSPPQIFPLGELIRRLIVLWRERDPESMVQCVEFL